MTIRGDRKDRWMAVRRTSAARQQAAREQALGTCPACGKRAYTSKATAKAAARRLYPGTRMRAYRCSSASAPWWHLTSQDAEHTARMRDQHAARAERSRT